jgi:predicted Zn-dependent protease with MMP-like domain
MGGIDSVAYRVSKQRFGELVEAALAEVPAAFEEYLEEVSIEVRQRPAPEQLTRVGTRRGNLLLGLYHGRPRTRRSVEDSGALPDVIYIFQETIEQVAASEQELIRQVRTTVLHEIGHHFGMDEQDLSDLGYG